MENRKITMNDIAREAGVAKSTVSRYFNGGYVKEETRQKLKAIIDAYQYEPSQAAQNLKSRETRTIGIIAATLDSITSSRMMMSMDAYLKQRGYTSLIINTSHDVNEEIKALEYFQSLRADGIILIATNLNLIHQRLIHESRIPVLIVAQPFKNGPSICYDDYQAGYDLGQYVAEKGHESVLYLGVSRVDYAVGVQRRNGVLNALSEHGVQRIHTRESDFSFERARRVIARYLEDHHPTAIICATDNMALAAYKEICSRGLNVPEDISLAGFGGYEVSQLITPNLCTVRFDNELAGKMAAITILALIKAEPVATTQLIGYELIKGGSVCQYSGKEPEKDSENPEKKPAASR